MRRLLTIFFLFLTNFVIAQSTLTVEINGLEDGDSATVKLTKGPFVLIVKKALNPQSELILTTSKVSVQANK